MRTSLVTGALLLMFLILAIQQPEISARDDDDGGSRRGNGKKDKDDDSDSDEDDDGGSRRGNGKKDKDDDDSDEVEDGHKRHSQSHDNGKCFCEDNWKSLSDEQQNTIKVILEFFKTQDDFFTGQIEFNKISYSVDFIYTYLSFNGKNIKEINEIYFLSILNFQKLNYGGTSTSYANLQYTLSLIQETSQSSNSGGSISYNGYSFSVEFVLQILEKRGIEVEEVTTEILEEVFNTIVSVQLLSSNSGTLPNKPNKKQEKVLVIIKNFLVTEGGQKSVTFEYLGAIIISQQIFDYSEQNEVDISDTEVTEFYEIIRNNVASPEDVNSDIVETLTEVLGYIKLQGDHPTGYINYYGLPISVDYCLSYLYLQELSINTINETYIQQAITAYIESESQGESVIDLIVTLVLDALDQGIETGSISYQGVIISIEEIKETISQITEEEVMQAITSISNAPSTTTESPQNLPESLTEQDTQILSSIVQVIQSGVPDENGSFQFYGIDISYKFVSQYLEKHNIHIDALDAELLFVIIKEFVEVNAGSETVTSTTEETNPPSISGSGSETGAGDTTDKSGPTSVSEPEATESETGTTEGTTVTTDISEEVLDSILNILKGIIHTSVPLEYITYGNYSISTDFLLSYISIHGISIDEATATVVHEAINLYVEYLNSYGEETDLDIEFIKNTLKEGNDQGTVYYQGNEFSLNNVLQAVKENGDDVQTLTTQQLEEVLSTAESSLSTTTASAPEPLGDQPTEKQREVLDLFVLLFQNNLYDINEIISFSGYYINTEFIIEYMNSIEKPVTEITSDLLFEIISQFVKGTSATPISSTESEGPTESVPTFGPTGISSTPSDVHNTNESEPISSNPTGSVTSSVPTSTPTGKDTTTTSSQNEPTVGYESEILDAILNIFKGVNDGSVFLEYITYENYTIPIDFFRTYISIQGIPIDEANAEVLYDAINSYLEYQNNYGGETDLILELILKFLKEGKDQGTVYYQGYEFSLSVILQVAQENGYDVQSFTEDQIVDVLSTVKRSLPSTTTSAPEPIGEKPTEEQEKILEFYIQIFVTGSYDISDTISFVGHKISIEYIVVYCERQNIEITELTSTILFEIIKQYIAEQVTSPEPTTSQLTEEDKAVLESVLEDIKTSGQSSSTIVTFEGHEISTSFFVTYLSITGTNIQEVTIEQLYFYALVFIQTKESIQVSNSEISIQEAVTLQIILNEFKKGEASGEIVYEGEAIPKKYVFQVLLTQNITIEYINYEKLYYIIYLYRVNIGEISLDNVEVPENVKPSVNQVLQYLKQYGERASGILTFNDKQVSIQVIWEIILISGIDIEKVDVKYIWIVINVVTKGEAEGDPKTILYQNVIETFKAANNGQQSILQINDQNITVETLAQIFDLTKDSSGKYDVSGLTVDGVWGAIQTYLNSPTSNIREIVQQALEAYNKGKTVSLRYEGQTIPIKDLIKKLGLKKLNGKYDTNDVTEQQLYDALDSIVKTSS